LEHGVKVWRGYDAKHKRSLIHFEIVGAKVKARQGQPVRHIAYAEEDGHKTQQRYGTASQASHGRLLRPVIVEAERAIRRVGPRHPAIRPDEVEPAP
jgi:hypothetical protein